MSLSLGSSTRDKQYRRLEHHADIAARSRHVAAAHRHASALKQSVMADFIADGHFGRHLRRMQRVYGERRQALVDSLAQWTSRHLALLPSLAGLHVAGFLPRGFDAEELVQRAYEAGVGLYSTAPFYVGRPRPGLIFGYAGCTVVEIEEGARRLGGILRSMSAPPRARRSSVTTEGAPK
jgi:GntR family transcriptional regulator/MocR family aminotransferase